MESTIDDRRAVAGNRSLLERVDDGLPIVVPSEFGRLDREISEPCILTFTPTYWQEWYWSEQWAMWMHRMVTPADQESLIDYCPFCGDEYTEPCSLHVGCATC